MKNTVMLALFISAMGLVPASLDAGKKSKNGSTNVVKQKKAANYSVMEADFGAIPEVIEPVALINLIEDILELQPTAAGYTLRSNRHYYDIACFTEAYKQGYHEQIEITTDTGLFIVPEPPVGYVLQTGTMIGTIDGATYRLKSVEKLKATFKNPEKLLLRISVTY